MVVVEIHATVVVAVAGVVVAEVAAAVVVVMAAINEFYSHAKLIIRECSHL